MPKLTKEQLQKIQGLKQELDFKLQKLHKKQLEIISQYHEKLDKYKKAHVKSFIAKIKD